MQIGDGKVKCLINFKIWFTNIKSTFIITKCIFNIYQWDLI